MKPAARHKARIYVLQALYEWLLASNKPRDIIKHFEEEYDFTKADTEYFEMLLQGVIANEHELDKYMQPYLDRSFQELNPIELSVMRIAIYELKNCLDVPYRVVINEALELTKRFGAQDGFKYVNGVLDRVAKDLRKSEFSK